MSSQLSNIMENDFVNLLVKEGIVKPEKVKIKDGRLVKIDMNNNIADFIVNLPYSELNVKRLLHIKTVKKIGENYKFAFALTKFFLKNNDIASADVHYKQVIKKVGKKSAFKECTLFMNLIKTLFQKKYKNAVSDYQNLKINELLKNKYPTYFTELEKILEGNDFNEENVKNKRSKITELLITILLEKKI